MAHSETWQQALAVGQWPVLHLVQRLPASDGRRGGTEVNRPHHQSLQGHVIEHGKHVIPAMPRGTDSDLRVRLLGCRTVAYSSGPWQSHHVHSQAENQQLDVPSVRASRTVLAWARVPSRGNAKVKINVQCIRRDVGGG